MKTLWSLRNLSNSNFRRIIDYLKNNMPGPDDRKRWMDSVAFTDLKRETRERQAAEGQESAEEFSDIRVLGMKDLSRLISMGFKKRAMEAEAQITHDESPVPELTEDEIAAYVERRTKAGKETTPDDIENHRLHKASRSKKQTYPLTKELMSLMEQEKFILGKMRRDHATYDEREAYIASSPNQRRIKALLFQLGLAEMLILGDWSVNREHTVAEGFGVVSFEKIETNLLHFYRKHNLLLTEAPLKEDKLVHLHAGCGNGVMMERLRRSKVEPFENGRRLLDYWSEMGFADRIYFPLEDLLLTFVKDEYRDNPALLEFIKMVTTLLLRRIHFAKHFRKRDTDSPDQYQKERIFDITKDVNVMRKILITLPAYIRNLAKLKHIKGDGEFLRDTDRPLSAECLSLIDEYLSKDPEDKGDLYLRNAKAWERVKKGEAAKGPVSFVDKYFKPEFFDDSVNLNEHITIYPHRLLLGQFEKTGDIFPETPIFDLIHTFRAASHLEDEPYKAFMKALCLRLKPGAVLLDDGYRESYTRYERVPQWLELARELGPEYRVEVIADSGGPKSIFVQRCINKDDGSFTFFSDAEKDELLLKSCSCVPIEEFAKKWPERMVRNHVVRRLKEDVFIDVAFEPDEPLDRRHEKVSRGRFGFTGLHDGIDRVLEEHVFGRADWRTIRREPTDSPQRQSIDHHAFGIVGMEIARIHERLQLVSAGALPLRKGSSVQTFRPKWKPNEGIYRSRKFPLDSLPRNLRVPKLEDLEREKKELQQILSEIRKITGKPPIRLIEFDNCFTNVPMLFALAEVLGAGELSDTEHVEMKSGNFSNPDADAIYIIGGSTNDTYDPHGVAFTERFSVPLLQRIERGEAVRVFGTCFGSQSCLEAYGRLKDIPIQTVQGALQFGAFPIRFERDHACLTKLGGQTCTVAMTRSGYTLVPGYEKNPDMIPLAYECSGLIKPEKWMQDFELPPVAFACMNGRVVTSQFHTELRFVRRGQREMLRKYLLRNHAELQKSFSEPAFVGPSYRQPRGMHPKFHVRPRELDSPHFIFNNNIDLAALDKSGEETHWVAREVGPAFIISTLLHLSRSLLAQLKKRAPSQ